jgi:hypothetical protein
MRNGLSAFAWSLIAFSVLPVYAASGDVASTSIDYAKWIGITSQSFLGLASVAVAILAYRTWRIQFVSKERYSLARRALLNVYQVKEGILLVRALFRYIDIDALTNKLIEQPSKLAETAEMTEKASEEALQQSMKIKKAREEHRDLYNERWNEVWSEGLGGLIIELRMIASETGVVIGNDVRQKLELLGQCLRDLQTARDDYFEVGSLLLTAGMAISDTMRSVYQVGELYQREIHNDLEVDKIKKARAVIHSTDKEDEFGKKVDAIVGAIESSLQVHLKLH